MREKAKKLIELLSNNELLEEERDKCKKNREKIYENRFGGISSEDRRYRSCKQGPEYRALLCLINQIFQPILPHTIARRLPSANQVLTVAPQSALGRSLMIIMLLRRADPGSLRLKARKSM